MVTFKSYSGEGKGFMHLLRDTALYRPHLLFLIPFYGVIAPGFIIYAYMTGEQKTESLSRFRPRLIVFRDDDPRIRNIIKYDENGKRIQLEPRAS